MLWALRRRTTTRLAVRNPTDLSSHHTYSRYKYNIIVDGNAAPSQRLASMLQSGSTLLKQESPSHAGAYLDAARVRRRARIAVEHRGQRAVIAARVKWVEALRMDSIPCIMPVVARDATAGNRDRAVDGTGRTHTHAINPAHINHLHVTDTSTFAECPF